MKCVNSKGISFINLNHGNIFIFTIKIYYKPKNPYEPDSKYFDKAKNNFLVIVSFNPKVGWMLLLHTVLVI